MTRGRGKLEVVSRNELEGVAKLDSSSLSLGRCYQTEWKVLSSGGRCCESEAEGVAKRKSECDSSANGDSGGHQVVERVAKRGGRCCKKGRASVTQLQNG